MPWEFGFPLSSLVFQIVERFHQWFLYWRMFGKGLQLKTTALLVLFLWLVKSLKNLLRIGLFITLRTVAFFLIINLVLGLLDQLQISQLYLIDLVGLLTGPWATRAVVLDISKVFDRVWHAGLHKLGSYGVSCQIFGLISSFLCNRRLWLVLGEKSSQEYPVNVWVPQGSILGPTHFLLYITDLPDNVICDISIYSDSTAHYSAVYSSNNWPLLIRGLKS